MEYPYKILLFSHKKQYWYLHGYYPWILPTIRQKTGTFTVTTCANPSHLTMPEVTTRLTQSLYYLRKSFFLNPWFGVKLSFDAFPLVLVLLQHVFKVKIYIKDKLIHSQRLYKMEYKNKVNIIKQILSFFGL